VRILNIYIAKTLLHHIALTVLVLLGLFLFVAFIDELGELNRGQYGITQIIQYVILSIPKLMYEVFPMAALIGSILGLSVMAKSSELTAIRASGVSVRRIVGSVAQVGLVLGLIALLMGEVISPYTETKAQKIRAESIQSGVRKSGKTGIWLRDENTYVNVTDVLPDFSLLNIKIFEFDQNNFLRFLSVAKAGTYQDQKWLLQGLRRTMINNASSAADEVDAAYWSTVVNPQILQVFLIQPEQLSLWQLSKYIKHLEANRQRTDNYELAFWSKLITPIATIVMLILAVPFVFQHARSGTMGRSLFSGIMIGLCFFILNKAFSYFVPLFEIAPFVGAITPTLLVAVISVLLIRRIR